MAAEAATPLERQELSAEARAAIAAYDEHRTRAAELSGRILAANRAVNVIKERAAAGNVTARQADLVRLQTTKLRQEPNIAPLCDAYVAEKAAKTATERDRDQARQALEQSYGLPSWMVEAFCASIADPIHGDQSSECSTDAGRNSRNTACRDVTRISNFCESAGAELRSDRRRKRPHVNPIPNCDQELWARF